MLVDQNTEDVIVPLNAALDCGGRLELANSGCFEFRLDISLANRYMMTIALVLQVH